MRGSIERFLSLYGLYIVQESKGRTQAHAWRQEVKQKNGGISLAGLLPLASSACLLTQARTTCPGWHPSPAENWSLPHQKQLRKYPQGMLTGQCDRVKSSVEGSFFQMTTIVNVKLKESITNKHSSFLFFSQLHSFPSHFYVCNLGYFIFPFSLI